MSDLEDVEMEDSNGPTGEECRQRCQEFASITSTDSAIAMIYLQDCNWNLETALNVFFSAESSTCVTKSNCVDKHPNRVVVMSWNLDGLDKNQICQRTEAAVAAILEEKAHVVLLQEVIPATEDIFRRDLANDYDIFSGKDIGASYFNMILIGKSFHAQKSSCEMQYFENTSMERHIVQISCTIKSIPIVIMTSHLESMKPNSTQRKQQLSLAWNKMINFDPNQNVIFAGDLNLRDFEVRELGGLPSTIKDIWEITGSRKEASATWDTTRNTNAKLYVSHPVKNRFDRMYFRGPYSLGSKALHPVYFELCGLQKVPQSTRFPSDHWGILGHFDI